MMELAHFIEPWTSTMAMDASTYAELNTNEDYIVG